MKFIVIIFCNFFFLFSCNKDSLEINEKLEISNAHELSTEEKIVQHLQRNFNTPRQLKLNETLLKTVRKKLEEENIQYWLEGGTLLAALRFQSLSAWDRDLELGVTKSSLDASYSKFKSSLLEDGFSIKKGKSSYYIQYEKSKFISELKKQDNEYSLEKIESLWEKETSSRSNQLELFVYEELNSKLQLQGYWKNRKGNSLAKNIIFPRAETKINKTTYKMPAHWKKFIELSCSDLGNEEEVALWLEKDYQRVSFNLKKNKSITNLIREHLNRSLND